MSTDQWEWSWRDLPSPQDWDISSIDISTKPGVYSYYDAEGSVLYVGKAKSLKDRLYSYRRQVGMLPKTREMLKQCIRTRYYEVESELDALLLEAELIRLYQPPYNVLLKDDKSPLYITISKGAYPVVSAMRKEKIRALDEQVTLFGPYPSGKMVRRILKLARRSFPYCSKTRRDGKPCFYFHLDLCPGACIEALSADAYQEQIRSLTLFLRGKKHRLRRRLTSMINEAAKHESYETAERYRKQLEAFEYITSYYKGISWDAALPNLTDDRAEHQLVSLRKLLTSNMALPNDYSLKRIEAYDISNTQGKSATGSMVVMHDGRPDTNAYRRFRIRSGDSPNDVAMMREMLSRRTRHTEWGIPNLIIIDGGRGQLRGALQEIPWSIPIISLVKRPERLLFPSIDGQTGKVTYIAHPIKDGTPLANLVQELRDESHRFAKTYHGKLATKRVLEQ